MPATFIRSTFTAAAIATLLTAMLNPTGAEAAGVETFTITIENVSVDDTLKLPDGGATRAPIAPGAYTVYQGVSPIFTAGRKARPALERLAEDGAFEVLANQLGGTGGAFFPGQPFQVTAKPGDRLAFATMFVQSNDSFYGPKGDGLALFDAKGNPIKGDVTAMVALYDAGTEVDEAPGVGPSQAPRQPKADTGRSERHGVRPVHNSFTYPPPAQVIRVIVEPATTAATAS